MTTTPSQPDLQKVLNNLTKRIRDLERRPSGVFQDFYVADGCVYWRGEGSVRDPYQVGLNIDPDNSNQLICNEAGLFVGGSTGTFDAVVDSTFVVSDPEARAFKGIGEALSYLDGLGMRNVIVLVRANNTTDYSIYSETANWSAPDWVTLIGVGQTYGMTNGFSGITAQWRHNGFSGGAATYYIENIYLNDPTTFSGNALFLNRCAIGGDGTSDLFTGDVGIYQDCTFTGSGVKRLGANVFWRGGHVAAAPSTASTFFIATTFLYMEGVQFRDSMRFTVPLRAYIKLAPEAAGFSGSLRIECSLTNSGSLTVEDTGTGAGVTGGGNFNAEVVITGGGVGVNHRVHLVNVGNITTSANTGGRTTILGILGAANITGPASIDCSIAATNGITLSGNAINGKFVMRPGGAVYSGTAITCVGLINSVISAAMEGSGAAAGAKPFALDATSVRNIVQVAGASTWPVAGTDLGTDNQIQTS